MRYYLVGPDKEDIKVDLDRSFVHSSELVSFEFSLSEEEQKKKIYVRKLAGMFFTSYNLKTWKKMADPHSSKVMNYMDKTYDVFRGYKPSGLSSGGAGELLTQMPGKVVRVKVTPEQTVSKGDTLIILEAMKMENEIKSAIDGVVKAVHVKEGDALEQGVLMMEIEEN
jgi:biotin carboxyl carrier protein